MAKENPLSIAPPKKYMEDKANKVVIEKKVIYLTYKGIYPYIYYKILHTYNTMQWNAMQYNTM